MCDPPGAGFREAVSSKRFFLLWLMGLMVFTPGLTLSGLYKRFGMTSGAVIADDRFQSAMGGLAAVANGLGRVFFGALVYLSLQEGWVKTDNRESLEWLALILVSVFLGIGLSGAIIWRRATGQVVTDEAPDIDR